MEAPIAVEGDHRFAIVREVKGLRGNRGRTRQTDQGEHGDNPKAGTKAHRRIAREAANKTWFDANAAGGWGLGRGVWAWWRENKGWGFGLECCA